MLEERLSHTYGQHSSGGYASHPPRSSSNIYPTISSNIAGGAGGAESFYTGNAPASSGGYGYSNPSYDNYQSIRSPEPAYGRGPAIQQGQRMSAPSQTPNQSTYMPQRASSFQNYPQTPTQRTDGAYFPESQPQGYSSQAPPAQQPTQGPQQYSNSQQPVSPIRESDSAVAFYQENQKPNASSYPFSQPPMDQAFISPNPSSDQYQQQPPSSQYPPQQPTYPASQPQQIYAQQLPQQQYPIQNHQAPPAPQQDYTQQPQSVPQTQSLPHQQSNIPYGSTNQYTQESFPAAPHHNPQPKVEESLIEL